MVPRVRQVELAPRQREAVGLLERRLRARRVLPAPLPTPRDRRHREVRQRERPHLVVVGVGEVGHAVSQHEPLGVLDQGRARGTVRVAPAEQVRTDERLHVARSREGSAPHRAGLGVDPVQVCGIARETAGLGQRRRGKPVAVVDVFPPRPREDAQDVRAEVQLPDLVRARVGDVEGAVVVVNVPRRSERCRGCVPRRELRVGARPGPGDRRHLVRGQVDRADCVVARVRHPECVSDRREFEPLRVAEASLAGAAVRETRVTRPERRDHPSGQVRHDDAVVPCVRDEDAVPVLVHQHLAREREESRGDLRVQVERDRRRIDQAPLREVVVHVRDDRLEALVDPLPGRAPDHAPPGIDQRHGRPRPHPPLPPDGGFGVVHDGVLQPVARDRFGHRRVLVFLRVLARVHADDHEAVRELVLETVEVGKDVLAVDAALRPEVQEHQLAPQLREAQGLAHVEPRQARRELRRRVLHLGLGRGLTGRLLGRGRTRLPGCLPARVHGRPLRFRLRLLRRLVRVATAGGGDEGRPGDEGDDRQPRRQRSPG